MFKKLIEFVKIIFAGNDIIKDYDDRGNLIHYKYFNTFEEWIDYNHMNKTIHYRNSNGYEYWNEYDEYGNEIHHKCNNGFEIWKVFDPVGHLLSYKDSNGLNAEYDKKELTATEINESEIRKNMLRGMCK